MQQTLPSCNRFGVEHKCVHCQSLSLIKSGIANNGKQRMLCKTCNRRFVTSFTYHACRRNTNNKIIQLLKEGVGIRSTARLLKISATTVLKRILKISKGLSLPVISKGKTYEVDELRTFVKRKDKQVWIVCALERSSKKIVSFNIGPRTNKTLDVVLKTLRLSEARCIHTDGLQHYRYLIDPSSHKVNRYATNHIERNNLTLRTHLKRLNRRTICFSRSMAILRACLLIYFFY
jgi:insertion element IS1 protein InsB